MNVHKTILGLLAPVITAAAAWLTASVAKYGVHLDPSGVNAAMVAGATAGISVMLKLIHDVETGVAKDVPPEVSAPDAQVIAGVLQAAEPQIRQAVLTAVEAEVISLARSIQPPVPQPQVIVPPAPMEPAPVEPAPVAGEALAVVAEPAIDPPAGDPPDTVGHPLLNGRAMADIAVPASDRGRIPRQG